MMSVVGDFPHATSNHYQFSLKPRWRVVDLSRNPMWGDSLIKCLWNGITSIEIVEPQHDIVMCHFSFHLLNTRIMSCFFSFRLSVGYHNHLKFGVAHSITTRKWMVEYFIDTFCGSLKVQRGDHQIFLLVYKLQEQ
jgi:hypothetical protein